MMIYFVYPIGVAQPMRMIGDLYFSLIGTLAQFLSCRSCVGNKLRLR